MAPAPLLLVAVIALVAALAGGLARLDWPVPAAAADLATAHGPLMVSGFLGTVIGLERAVALRRWTWAAPVLSALAAAALVAGIGDRAAPALATAASMALFAVLAHLWRRDRSLAHATMAAGALAWGAGNVTWLLDRPLQEASPWWAGFFVLMIAGERLELTRVFPRSRAQLRAFVTAAAVVGAGLVLAVVRADAGVRLAGAGLVALAAWLGRWDVARRTVREHGLTRFMAVCLLCGYAWLAVAGVLWIVIGPVEAGPLRDAALHALFLGFVFGMIFAHAPAIFPSVVGRPVAWSPSFYLPLIGLQATLALRVGADLAGWSAGRQVGGLLGAAVLLAFFANTAYAIFRPRRGARS